MSAAKGCQHTASSWLSGYIVLEQSDLTMAWNTGLKNCSIDVLCTNAKKINKLEAEARADVK